MGNITVSPTKAIIEALLNHLEQETSSFKYFYGQFPAGNKEIKYPSLSLITKGDAIFVPMSPTAIKSLEDLSEKTSTHIDYIVGSIDQPLQIDIWCNSKDQRHAMYEEISGALSSQFPTSGLSLSLPLYHNTKCLFTERNFRMIDNEGSAQRKEWRVIVDVDANLNKIKRVVQPLMKEITVETQLFQGEIDE